MQIHLNSLKTAASELTYQAVDRMVQLAGLAVGYGADSPVPLERTLRDLRSAALNYSNDRLWTANERCACSTAAHVAVNPRGIVGVPQRRLRCAALDPDRAMPGPERGTRQFPAQVRAHVEHVFARTKAGRPAGPDIS
ncbi:hypothetical protein SANTM175S_06022 [Streptomyces antimycoticus]